MTGGHMIVRMHDEAEPSAPSRPHPVAQRMELPLRFQRYHATGKRFVPGVDFVREKRGLGYTEKEFSTDLVRLFWRYLVPADPVDMVIITDFLNAVHMSTVDCLVAEMTMDGSSIVIIPHDTRMLELDNENE